MPTIYNRLIGVKKSKNCGFLVLLDPDRKKPGALAKFARAMESAGADGFLIGSSLMVSSNFERAVRAVKKAVKVPLIIFPNGSGMLSPAADAVLFMSLLSGRNPNFLIEEQVKAAPLIKTLKIEPIATGYILIESGNLTSVCYMSNTMPIPRDKPDIAKAHALAAQYMGMKLVYLEAGSARDSARGGKIYRVADRSRRRHHGSIVCQENSLSRGLVRGGRKRAGTR